MKTINIINIKNYQTERKKPDCEFVKTLLINTCREIRYLEIIALFFPETKQKLRILETNVKSCFLQ